MPLEFCNIKQNVCVLLMEYSQLDIATGHRYRSIERPGDGVYIAKLLVLPHSLA